MRESVTSTQDSSVYFHTDQISYLCKNGLGAVYHSGFLYPLNVCFKES